MVANTRGGKSFTEIIPLTSVEMLNTYRTDRHITFSGGVPKNYRLEKIVVGGSSSATCYKKEKERCVIYTTENKDVCTVRSLDLANYLCNNGYKMKKVLDSEKNPRFKVFLFENSKAIQNSIATYLLQKGV